MGTWFSVPVLFKDDSVSSWRPWRRVKGRPYSLRWYTSDNQRQLPPPRALKLPLDPTGKPDPATAPTWDAANAHGHTLEIKLGDLPADITTLPATTELRTTPAAGHFHAIKLTKDQLLALLERRDPGKVTTEI